MPGRAQRVPALVPRLGRGLARLRPDLVEPRRLRLPRARRAARGADRQRARQPGRWRSGSLFLISVLEEGKVPRVLRRLVQAIALACVGQRPARRRRAAGARGAQRPPAQPAPCWPASATSLVAIAIAAVRRSRVVWLYLLGWSAGDRGVRRPRRAQFRARRRKATSSTWRHSRRSLRIRWSSRWSSPTGS